MSKLKERGWHGRCREWYSLKADARELKKYAPNKTPPELGYMDLVGDIVKDILDAMHHDYFERGEKFVCTPFTSIKRVPPDVQATEGFSYVDNISYFYICNKAIIELTLDEKFDDDIRFHLTIIAPCHIIRDFLKQLLLRTSSVGILVV